MFSNVYVGDVAFKVRTSKEMYVSNYQGNLLNKENNYIEVAGFDSDKSIAVEISYNANLSSSK